VLARARSSQTRSAGRRGASRAAADRFQAGTTGSSDSASLK
jgi:hypothetical protein